jgi:uncharacterized protein
VKNSHEISINVEDPGVLYDRALTIINSKSPSSKVFRKALKQMKSLAEEGFAFAQHCMGYLHHNGFGVDRDISEAIKWHKLSAIQGNVDSQIMLGDIYLNGVLDGEDYGCTVKCYHIATESRASVEDNLDMFCDDDYCLAPDIQEAFKYYSQAADQGDREGLFHLGLMYYDGLFVEQDCDEGLRLIQLSASQGFPVAIHFLWDLTNRSFTEESVALRSVR